MPNLPSIEEQMNAQYLAIGRFVVEFEHLIFAIKQKFNIFCGMYEELSLIVEKLTVKQSIDALNDIILYRIENQDKDDTLLYKQLIKDLNYINEYRNSIIHTMWLIGWRSESQTDITEFSGQKFSGSKNFKNRTNNVENLEYHTKVLKSLWAVFWTCWPIDNVNTPKLSELFLRNEKRIWIRK